jgi:hypothetical protein
MKDSCCFLPQMHGGNLFEMQEFMTGNIVCIAWMYDSTILETAWVHCWKCLVKCLNEWPGMSYELPEYMTAWECFVKCLNSCITGNVCELDACLWIIVSCLIAWLQDFALIQDQANLPTRSAAAGSKTRRETEFLLTESGWKYHPL